MTLDQFFHEQDARIKADRYVQPRLPHHCDDRQCRLCYKRIRREKALVYNAIFRDKVRARRLRHQAIAEQRIARLA